METAPNHGAGYCYLDQGMAEGVQKELIMELPRQTFPSFGTARARPRFCRPERVRALPRRGPATTSDCGLVQPHSKKYR